MNINALNKILQATFGYYKSALIDASSFFHIFANIEEVGIAFQWVIFYL